MTDGDMDALEQGVVECAPGSATTRATGEAEEVLFVLAGQGELRLGGERYPLEPEAGVNLGPEQEYALGNIGSGSLLVVSVRIPRPAPKDRHGPERVTVRRLAEQQAQPAATDRFFRIVADPRTGLRSATQFVGYIPTERAPDHFHTYDEVIYVLYGEGIFHTGADRRPIKAGSCIELPARTVHCLENTSGEVMRIVAVFRPPGSPAAAYFPDGTPAYPGTPLLTSM